MSIRKALLVAAICGLSALNLEAQSQELPKIPRIGLLIPGSEASSRVYFGGLQQGLNAHGLIEGKTIHLEVRYASGQIDRLGPLATELVTSGVDLIFTGGDQGAWAAKRSTKQLPIVAVTCDALASGLLTDLARPGGNFTGVTCINSDLSGKRVELMKETVPALLRLGAVFNPSDTRMAAELRET